MIKRKNQLYCYLETDIFNLDYFFISIAFGKLSMEELIFA